MLSPIAVLEHQHECCAASKTVAMSGVHDYYFIRSIPRFVQCPLPPRCYFVRVVISCLFCQGRIACGWMCAGMERHPEQVSQVASERTVTGRTCMIQLRTSSPSAFGCQQSWPGNRTTQTHFHQLLSCQHASQAMGPRKTSVKYDQSLSTNHSQHTNNTINNKWARRSGRRRRLRTCVPFMFFRGA